MARKTLSVSEETFELIDERREDGESWDEYHRRTVREHETYSRMLGEIESIPERTAELVNTSEGSSETASNDDILASIERVKDMIRNH